MDNPHRLGDTIPFEPCTDSGKVVLVHKRHCAGLEWVVQIDGYDGILVIVRNGVHLYGKCIVAAIGGEVQAHLLVIEFIRFHVSVSCRKIVVKVLSGKMFSGEIVCLLIQFGVQS